MDFRQYDQALGRFNVMDALSEMAYDQTPYRYGFNNPVFWKDPSGLFETKGAAQSWIDKWELTNATISYNEYKNVYEITNGNSTFYQRGEDIISSMYSLDTGITIEIIKGGASGGGKSLDNRGLAISTSMWLGNTGLGILSTNNVFDSGFLKSNELWHKTKTRGYSFATQNKWKNSGAKYWRNQQTKPYQSARKLGSKLTKAGGVLLVTDIAMSGQLKPSHGINIFMLGISGTGVGSIVAGGWFIADMGTGAYNYFFTDDGFRTLSDVIDESVGTYQMYEGLY